MINIIVVQSINRVIGVDGYIVWKHKNQKQFESLTTNNIIIMGKKAYEELRKPLDNRVNAVITSKDIDGVLCYRSLIGAINDLSEKYSNKNIYIIGGEELFKYAVSNIIIDTYYITVLKTIILDGNKYFPLFNRNEYDEKILEENDEVIRYKYYRKEYL